MAELVHGLDPERVRTKLAVVRAEIAAAAARAGRSPERVELLAAVKYLPLEELGALSEAGVELVGENRAQELIAKASAYPDQFRWDFIGHLQSRKVKQLLPLVRYIHSVASESVLLELARHADRSTEVLVEVNVAGEESKSGIPPRELETFIERCPATVVGLMTMPPLTADAESSRPYFTALRELAEAHDLTQLSMGTSQDFQIAVEEGATIVRIGSMLYG